MWATAVLLTAFLGAVQATQYSPEVRRLYDLIKEFEEPLRPEAFVLIEQGLASTDAAVRRAAIETIHAFAFIGHGKKNRSSPEAWRAERERMMIFAPVIVRALSDQDERIRHHAVMALGALDSTVDRGTMVVSADTLTRFARMFQSEPSRLVRYEIAKTFALLADMRPEIPTEQVLASALDDADPGVVQMGATGIGNARLPKYLPRLVPLLRHPSPGISMAAAVSFQTLAPDAGPFIPDLQRAADAAPAGPFKQTLLTAIRLIREKARR